MELMGSLGEKIGDGGVAEVYARNGKAVKLYKHHIQKQEAFYEALISTIIETTGLPVPKMYGIYQIDNRWAIEMELLEGSLLSELVEQQPDEITKYLDLMIDMHVRIHNVQNLPELLSQKQRLKSRIENVNVLNPVQKEKLVSGLLKMSDRCCLCHGDYHYKNLLVNKEKAYIIDWVDATIGDPAADVCRTYMLYKLYDADIADPYIERYSSKSGIPLTEIKAWLPYIAAARLDDCKSNETEQLLEWI